MAATRSLCSVVFGCFYAYLLLFLIHGPIQSWPKSSFQQHISKILGTEFSTNDTGLVAGLDLTSQFMVTINLVLWLPDGANMV